MAKKVYRVEKGIPMPEVRGMYPFAAMEVGDSFAFEEDAWGSVRTSASAEKRRSGRKFSVVFEDLRCWRVA